MTGGKPPWRRGRTGPGGEVPEIPLEEVQRRVDGREGIAPREPPRDPWIGGRDDLAPRPERSVTLAPARGAGPIPDPRRLLWRDSATILVFVVIALLVAQAFPPGGTGTPVSTEVPSGVVTGSLPPGFSLPPGVTFGPPPLRAQPSIARQASATSCRASTRRRD